MPAANSAFEEATTFPAELTEAFKAFNEYITKFKGTLSAANAAGGGGDGDGESNPIWKEMEKCTGDFTKGFNDLGKLGDTESLNKLLDSTSLGTRAVVRRRHNCVLRLAAYALGLELPHI